MRLAFMVLSGRSFPEYWEALLTPWKKKKNGCENHFLKSFAPHISLKPENHFPRMEEGNSDQKDQMKDNRASVQSICKGSALIPGKGSFSVTKL